MRPQREIETLVSDMTSFVVGKIQNHLIEWHCEALYFKLIQKFNCGGWVSTGKKNYGGPNPVLKILCLKIQLWGEVGLPQI